MEGLIIPLLMALLVVGGATYMFSLKGRAS